MENYKKIKKINKVVEQLVIIQKCLPEKFPIFLNSLPYFNSFFRRTALTNGGECSVRIRVTAL